MEQFGQACDSLRSMLIQSPGEKTINLKQIVPSSLKDPLSVLISLISSFVVKV